MSARVYVVGTDTDAGKTTVVCALLHAARRRGLNILPFKPAVSGPAGPRGDAERLLAAAGLDENELEAIAPLRYTAPIAPGIAEARDRFLLADPPEPDASALARVQWELARFEQRHDAAAVLIEGAGGLHVPMPGGTWQEQWIETLAHNTLVVARAGLGTINHTLLTIDALRERGCPPIGFVLSQLLPHHDPSRADNVKVIEARAELPCLGQLPFLGRPPNLPDHEEWLDAEIWTRILSAR